MNQNDNSHIARELIREVVGELQRIPSLVFVEENGSVVLVAKADDSVLHFNPQSWAEKIVSENVATAGFQADLRNDPLAQNRYVRKHSKKKIAALIIGVSVWLGDALWILKQLSPSCLVDEELGPFFQDVQKGFKVSTLDVIDARLRKLLRLPEKSFAISSAEYKQVKSGNYDYVIKDSQVIEALVNLERFSIKRLAQLLGPDRDDFRPSVYDWMKRKQMDRKQLEGWWRKLRTGVGEPEESSNSVEKPR
ncbi:MAG: hypothetical protein QOK48_2287 [Blastocatellia bacterium]|jgi:hypothetical protein|nr:hypothetical protein [Blastocatellia bacterium]